LHRMRAFSVWGISSVLFLAMSLPVNRAQDRSGKAAIETFNKKFIAAHLKMDHALILSFWEDDGVSLLPDTPPLVGKLAITKFVENAIASMPGYHVTKQEIDFRDIRVVGDWAFEWGLEHQVSEGPPGKPTFDGHGKILLILHQNEQGDWKLHQEMWNSAPPKE
jgi:ketosteroid isomerase-like protein